jgi:hypothetical protein
MELVQAISGTDEDPSQYQKPFVQPMCVACEFCEEFTERFTSVALPTSYTQDTAEPPQISFTRSVMKNEVDLRCEIIIRHRYNSLHCAVWADEGA